MPGGAIAGLVIGAGQTLVSRRRLDPRWWIPATAIGMGLGLLLGAAVVDYRTSLADLALMGALTGLVLGSAQALALPRHARRRWVWAAAMPALWALGWTVTTLGGIDVDQQFTVFGAYGALPSPRCPGSCSRSSCPTAPREQRAAQAPSAGTA